mmetsp:Transcript_14178/g.30587  ORF Transcript_14178/g.30587 Transcript_14178/m.30587 type:complete len:360 (-) Transcript_14178:83-1162(-)
MDNQTICVGGAVVVFAKCPIAGSSKTRLAPLLGPEGAAQLAKAMLSDILVSLSQCVLLNDTLKVLMYAPGTQSGESQMMSILDSLDISYNKIEKEPSVKNKKSDQITKTSDDEERGYLSFDTDGWVLLPMQKASKSDLTSSSLGSKLEDALERIRKLLADMVGKSSNVNNNNRNEAVLFLGMDSPEIPMEEIVYGLMQSNDHPSNEKLSKNCNASEGKTFHGKAHMCPANDGGYGLLSVPKHAPSAGIFSLVRWSDPLTAVSQLKALTDSGVGVSLGKLMYDVDEPGDVKELAVRLARLWDGENKTNCSSGENQSEDDSLTRLSFGIGTGVSAGLSKSYPHHTRKALLDLNVMHCDGVN